MFVQFLTSVASHLKRVYAQFFKITSNTFTNFNVDIAHAPIRQYQKNYFSFYNRGIEASLNNHHYQCLLSFVNNNRFLDFRNTKQCTIIFIFRYNSKVADPVSGHFSSISQLLIVLVNLVYDLQLQRVVLEFIVTFFQFILLRL